MRRDSNLQNKLVTWSRKEKANEEINKEKARSEEKIGESFPYVICYKCGLTGHYSRAYNKPKVCFICYSKAHVVEGYLEWRKAQQATQYYGSANKGLGFYHIDVASRGDTFRHWAGVDNKEIVSTLRSQIHKGWKRKLMNMDEYRFLVKFPPHKSVE
jgi:hypothetical protein